MSSASERIFRAAAIERLSSPEQLDQLVRIRRPFDVAAAVAITATLLAVITWSLLGHVALRTTGEGILVGEAGQVVDAVAAGTGSIESIDVVVGTRVLRGKVVAQIAQPEIERRYRNAVELHRERMREHSELTSAIDRELADKARAFAAVEAAIQQTIATMQRRVADLASAVDRLGGSPGNDSETQRTVEERRRELAYAEQRLTEARLRIARLRGQQLDLETQRERERLRSLARQNDAKRQMDELKAELDQGSQVKSPIDGRVIEIKSAAGSMIAAGAPLMQIQRESDSSNLVAVIYVPPDRSDGIKTGIDVHIEPAMVRREEFGSVIGTVRTISDLPVTPQAMNALLHNNSLVSRFSRDGAPYAVVVELERDGSTPSGYHWSIGDGPPARLTAGTPVRAEITTRVRRPIELVLPNIRRLTGFGG